MDEELEIKTEEALEALDEATEEKAPEEEEPYAEKVVGKEEYPHYFESEEEEEPKKKSGKKWIFGLIALAISLALIFFVFVPMFKDENKESLGEYSEPVLKIGDMEFTLSEFNYMYVSSFNEIYSNLYSYYSDSISNVIDITKPLEEQMVDETTNWDEYVKKYTVDSLKNMVGLYNAAKEEGFTLSEEYQADLDSIKSRLTETAGQGDMTLEEYIALMYGEGVTYQNIYDMTEIRYIAGLYGEEKQSETEVSKEDISAYYKENKNIIDTVDLRYFNIFYEGEEEPVLSKEQAEEYANTFLEAKNSEEFNTLVYERCTEEQKKYFEDGNDPTVFAGVNFGTIGIDEVNEWLFSTERKQGDVMIYNDENYKSYLIIMFECRNDPDYNFVNVRHILIAPEKGEDGKATEEAWNIAETRAAEILAKYREENMDEEGFANLAKENSADGNASKGGIYENVYKGQMVAPFENWCFDESRKPGDTDIVKTSFGYHIMYFVGVGENNLESLIKPTLVNEKVNAWIKELNMNLTEEKLQAFEKTGGMIDDIIKAATAMAEENSSEVQTENTEE